MNLMRSVLSSSASVFLYLHFPFLSSAQSHKCQRESFKASSPSLSILSVSLFGHLQALSKAICDWSILRHLAVLAEKQAKVPTDKKAFVYLPPPPLLPPLECAPPPMTSHISHASCSSSLTILLQVEMHSVTLQTNSK